MSDQEFYEGLGKRIAARRKELAQSQDQVAKRSGLSRATLASIEIGRQNVLVHQLCRLADTLNLNVATLLPPAPTSDAVSVKIAGSVTREQKAQIEQFFGSVTVGKSKAASQ